MRKSGVFKTVAMGVIAAVSLLGPLGANATAARKGSKGSQGKPSAQGTTYSGRATALRAETLGLDLAVADAGALPSQGGSREATLLAVDEPGLVSAEVLHASTIGQGSATRSEASAASLTLTPGGNVISADFLMARANAECSRGSSSTNGSSEVVGLVVNGQATEVSSQPNQTIPLPNGSIVINEQSSSDGLLTVNALHVVVTGVADVIVASASAGITCGKPACPANDFVTGGGFVTGTPTGDKGTFGVGGGIKNGSLWGHLTFVDHGSRMKVKSSSVTSYTVVDSTTRRIEGTAKIGNSGGYTYIVDVADNGEPGRADTFHLTLSNGYEASGTLRGGNIQLHPPCL